MSINEFKIGDWVVTHPTPNSIKRVDISGGAGYKPNILGRITTIDKSTYIPSSYICIDDGKAIYEGNFRHATEEEIRLGKPIFNKTYKIW